MWGNVVFSNSLTVQWLIQPNPPVLSISLIFTLFQTAQPVDIVQIFDGPSVSSPLVATYSGSWLPSPYRSTTGSLHIHWETSPAVEYLGWRAEYYSDSMDKTAFSEQFQFCVQNVKAIVGTVHVYAGN